MNSPQRTAIVWLRHDLRLADNPVWPRASTYDRLVCAYLLDTAQLNPDPELGFARLGSHRQHWLQQALQSLDAALKLRGQHLVVLANEQPVQALIALASELSATVIVADHPGHEERQAVAAVSARVATQLAPSNTLYTLTGEQAPQFVLPFTKFRHQQERLDAQPLVQLSAAPEALPPPPTGLDLAGPAQSPLPRSEYVADARSALPYTQPGWQSSETDALAHIARYFASHLPEAYKRTRNGLVGSDYSTKLSAWLAIGALSVQAVEQARRRHEAEQGASDGSYWIGFELLWREYFYALMQHAGRRAFAFTGLNGQRPSGAQRKNRQAFERWCDGRTGCDWVDAGMRELKHTGYLSNRMRQNVASYLIHDLGVDWRWGAAWFESQLMDFDVCSNQGNWLYLAGVGTDPRDGRRFDPKRQAGMYDPDGRYRALWLNSAGEPT